MKDLELTVYPKDDDGDYRHPEFGYKIWPDDLEVFADQKRLTNAELAAEYWHLSLELQEAMMQELAASVDKRKKDARHWSKEIGVLTSRFFILLGIARAPHYDEQDTP